MIRRAVVTGPTGAIGIALIGYLNQQNIEVLAVCRKGSYRKQYIPQHPLVHVVELNLEELTKLPYMAENTYDVFYHLGWDGTIGDSRNNMHDQLRNVQYTLDAVEAAAQMGCHRFVGAGSQAEYGRVEGKLSADTPVFPENGYGIAKLCAGQMSRIQCEKKGMEHIWTRILSVYGPHDGRNTMIMSTIEKILRKESPALTLGQQQWDYLYAKDAGRALYLLGERGKDGKIYCLGSGKVRTLRDYVETIRAYINPQIKLGFGQMAYSDKQVMYLCADIDSLQEDTGFVPEYSFETGIQETIAWVQKQVMD